MSTAEVDEPPEMLNSEDAITSHYFSTDSILRKIEKHIEFDGLVALLLTPDEECFGPLEVLCSLSASAGKILFWNGGLQQPLKKRFKYEPVQAVGVELRKLDDQFLIGNDNFDRPGQHGAPVLDENGSLIGFQVTSYGKNFKRRVVYRSLEKLCRWMKLMKFIG